MSASANGLFRATGKRAKPAATRDLVSGDIVQADQLPREKDDFYPTPPEPTLALMDAEAPHLARLRISRVWEPACGNGAMMRDLQSCGLDVVGSDLVDRGCGAHTADFFDFDSPFGSVASDDRSNRALADAAITNPPFDKVNWRDGKGLWISHALLVLKLRYMALLLPWNWPGAGGLESVWRDHPPARVYLMRFRIDFTGQGASPILFAWFVWDDTHVGPTHLLMLDRADPNQGDMFTPAQAVARSDLGPEQERQAKMGAA